MSSISSQNENDFSHRQGSVTSLQDDDDQITAASDPPLIQPYLSSSSAKINGYSKVPNLDDIQTSNMEKEYQTATIDLQTVPDINMEDNTNQNWEQLSRETSTIDQRFINRTQSDSTDDITTSFGFQQQNQIENLPREISPTASYETIIRSENLFFDPDPELIKKPQMIKPVVYTQNIKVKFLKPPSVPLGPLIIREVRPPQPPPPPPLVVRQRPLPPLSPPPLILREKPPQVPALMTTQVVTKMLPPIPPPPRTVIVEKLPPLPPKPRDIIIERWIPYEATTYKRKVVVQRAEFKPYPPPRNIIITYDKVEAKVIRQFERHAIQPEDPENYSARYGNSLLGTKDLLAKAKELGITEDLSPPTLIDHELQEQNFLSENSFSRRSSQGSYISDKIVHNDIDNNNYAPTLENLIVGLSSSINYDETNGQLLSYESNAEDLSTQLAQYGLTNESIPY